MSEQNTATSRQAFPKKSLIWGLLSVVIGVLAYLAFDRWRALQAENARLLATLAQEQSLLRQEPIDLSAMRALDGSKLPPKAPVSGLDLLSVPTDEKTSQQSQTDPEHLMRQSDELNANALKMLDSLAPLLDNAAITSQMSPEQKKDFKELKLAITDLKKSLGPGAAISQSEQQRRMQKIQRLMTRLMAGAGQR